VSEKADTRDWTGTVRLKDGRRLPDLAAWRTKFREGAGELFTIVGVEATIDGVLVEVAGEPALKMTGSDVVLRLQPLKQKVQMDPKEKRPQQPTRDEKEAHRRLVEHWARNQGPPPNVRIVGPLVEGEGTPAVLAVREFVWK
jgi:hypothetical protein